MSEPIIIMEVEVKAGDDDKIRVKFVALAGETGPELTMPRKMAVELFEKLALFLNQ